MVLEKDEEDQLEQSYEKWSITKSQGGKEHTTAIKWRKANWIGHILSCIRKHII